MTLMSYSLKNQREDKNQKGALWNKGGQNDEITQVTKAQA